MVGFGAEQVEDHLASHPVPGLQVDTFFNPLYLITDNLVTVWLAQRVMDGDFLLLNGDTLFDTPVLERLLAAPPAPITIAINEKSGYDEDDMKVILNGGRRLRSVGKSLDPTTVDGESIGLMRFQGEGVGQFRSALDAAVREEKALNAWYLSVLNGMAESVPIHTAPITGLWWGEIDSPSDLVTVRAFFDERKRPQKVYAVPAR
jgi:choline kinase